MRQAEMRQALIIKFLRRVCLYIFTVFVSPPDTVFRVLSNGPDSTRPAFILHHHAAIYCQHLPRYIAGTGTCQKECRVGNIFRLTEGV